MRSIAAVTLALAVTACLFAAIARPLLADASYAPPIRCISAADNPILGCWKRLYPSGNAEKDNAIWSFHADGYMRNGLPADLALGTPQLTGAFQLDAWSGRYVLRVEAAGGSGRWPALIVDFPSHDRMFWFRPQDGMPFDQWQRVAFIPRFPDNPDQLKHIFRPRSGHYPIDTMNNRRSILETINSANFVGIDYRGNEVYFRNNPDGSQNWTYVRNGIIQNAGINTDRRYGFDPTTKKVTE